MSSAHAFVEAVVSARQFEKRNYYFSSGLEAHSCKVAFANHCHVHKRSAHLLRFTGGRLSGIDLLACGQALLFQYVFDLFAGDVADGIDWHSGFKKDCFYGLAVRNSKQTIVTFASNVTNQIRNELLAETSVHIRSYN